MWRICLYSPTDRCSSLFDFKTPRAANLRYIRDPLIAGLLSFYYEFLVQSPTAKTHSPTLDEIHEQLRYHNIHIVRVPQAFPVVRPLASNTNAHSRLFVAAPTPSSFSVMSGGPNQAESSPSSCPTALHQPSRDPSVSPRRSLSSLPRLHSAPIRIARRSSTRRLSTTSARSPGVDSRNDSRGCRSSCSRRMFLALGRPPRSES
jgi:hypothetical protein